MMSEVDGWQPICITRDIFGGVAVENIHSHTPVCFFNSCLEAIVKPTSNE